MKMSTRNSKQQVLSAADRHVSNSHNTFENVRNGYIDVRIN